MDQIRAALTAAGVARPSLELLRSTKVGDVYVLAVPGDEAAVRLWERLRPELTKIGCCAVIASDNLQQIKEREQYCGSVETILAQAERLDAVQWLTAREQERLAEFAEMYPNYTPPLGDWPHGDEVALSFTTPFHILSGRPKKHVMLAILPTIDSWKAPGFLAFGGWNECPHPHEQCAMFKHWQGEFGSEVFAITDDIAECFVCNPPDTKPAAMALAKQQYIFCADIVEQGTRTIAALAAALLNSQVWYFWWD